MTRMAAAAHDTRALRMPPTARTAFSVAPQRVQNRSPISEGVAHSGHGGPRNAPPHREQKFASDDPARCRQCPQTTRPVVMRSQAGGRVDEPPLDSELLFENSAERFHPPDLGRVVPAE